MKLGNRGLTLIELLAVLIVLSIIAIIITPNIAASIKEYQERLYDIQVNGIKDAAKNWLADQIDQGVIANIPTEGNSVSVNLITLQNGGYVDPDLKDPRNKKKMNGYDCVTIRYAGEQYTYEFSESCQQIGQILK